MMKMAFYKGYGSLLSTLARWVDRGKYCHSELVFSSSLAFSSTIWDEPYGCRFIMLEDVESNKEWDVIQLPLSAVQEREALLYAKSLEGKGYDWLGLFGIAFREVKDDRCRLFCSEACLKVLQHIGYYRDMDAGKVSPNDLHKLLTDRPIEKEVQEEQHGNQVQ